MNKVSIAAYRLSSIVLPDEKPAITPLGVGLILSGQTTCVQSLDVIVCVGMFGAEAAFGLTDFKPLIVK